MKKTTAIILAAILVAICGLTACNSGVEKKAADVSTTAGEVGATATEIETIETSPYINVTDVNGDAVTVIGDDGNVYYQQMLREDASKAAADAQDAGGEASAEPSTQLVKVQNDQTINKDKATETVKNFLDTMSSRKFYLKGSMVSDGETLPVEFYICENDASMMTSMDGITLKIAIVDSDTYLVDDDKQIYMSLGEAVKKMLGVDDTDLVDMINSFSDTVIDYDRVITNTEAVDGVMYNVLDYPEEEGGSDGTKFYLADGKLVKMQMYNGGVTTGELVIDDIKGDITTNDIGGFLSNYSKVGYIEFISNMMENMEADD